MDFFTLINLLLVTSQVIARSEPGICPKFVPFNQILSFHGRVISWIPDNNGFNPFNSYDLWHLRFGYPLEMFVTSSGSIALNVTVRCQQPDPESGHLPPQSVWTGGRQWDPIVWSEENFGLHVDKTSLFLTGCKQLGGGESRAFGTMYAVDPELYNWTTEWYWNRPNCNFVNEFIIARTGLNLIGEKVYGKKEPYSAIAYANSEANELGSDWRVAAMEVFVIILINSCAIVFPLLEKYLS